jgi:hypothetical protein
VLQGRAHRGELRLVVAETALDDEPAPRDRRQCADLLGHEHRIPQRQEKQAPGRRVAPLGQEPAEDRHVLVVEPGCGVMVTDEERVEIGLSRRRGALDHPACSLARILHRVTARQRDPDSHRGPPPVMALGRELSRSSSRARRAGRD